MSSITRNPKRIIIPTALALSALVVLTACGAADPEGGSSAKRTAKPAEESVRGFPVGAPFGEAEWSIKADPSIDTTVDVRPDRLIVTTGSADTSAETQTVRAYTNKGEQAWTYKVPQSAQLGVLDRTVAVLAKSEDKGSGLDKPHAVGKLTLLSQEDGSVVKEIDIPDGTATINEFGSIAFYGDSGLSFVDEDSKITTVKAERAGLNDGGLVAGVPFWLSKNNSASPNVLNSESWTLTEVPGIAQKDIFEMSVLAVDNKLGLIVVQVGHGATAERSYFAVQAKTGKVAYALDCPGYSHSDSSTNTSRNSPNGQYGVLESLWLSESKGQCFGGGEQKSVELFAVGDDGTAYGDSALGTGQGNELVVVPAGGEPKVSHAPTPVGVMNGGIAIHVDGLRAEGTTFRGSMITGNPIK